MDKSTFSNSPLWKEFQKAARERRRNPVRFLTEYMRECLETWEDQRLDDEIRRDVRRSGFRAGDAVEIVRRHRLEKKGQRAAP